jgi:hypothetical protein
MATAMNALSITESIIFCGFNNQRILESVYTVRLPSNKGLGGALENLWNFAYYFHFLDHGCELVRF